MSDPFDSTALFAEFNRPRESSDRILLAKLKEKSPSRGSESFSNGVGINPDEKKACSVRPMSPVSGAESGESEGSEEEVEGDQVGSGDEGPVEIGRDDGGVLYRPGRREKEVGRRLLQHADYTDTDGGGTKPAPPGDNRDVGSEMQRLARQNMSLKKCARLIDPTTHIPLAEGDEGPAIQILFMNHKLARKYRAEIERFISDLIVRDDSHNDNMEDIKIRSHNVCTAEGADTISDQQTHLLQFQTSTVIGCSRFYRDFAVDNMGWPLVDYIPALTDGWEIPRYQQQFGKALPADDESDDDTSGPKKEKRPRASCFNCGGDHRLDGCKEQRNFKRIAENRRKFMDSMPTKKASLNEGHSMQMDPRFSKYQPGVIGSMLKKALGMKNKHPPIYIYKMRQLGYPPGHLAACRMETSGISMFDKHGRAMRKGTVGNNEEDALEDGEMDGADEEEETVLYDTTKLIEYPGFNVPLPAEYTDMSAQLGFPPMMPHHAKEFMERTLPSPKGVKRQHSETNQRTKRQRVAAAAIDMELDTEVEEADALVGHRVALYEADNVAPPTLWTQHYASVPLPLATYMGGHLCTWQYQPHPPPPPPPPPESPPPLPPDPPPHSPTPPPLPPDSPASDMETSVQIAINEPTQGAESGQQSSGLSRTSSTTSFGTHESGAETPTLEDLEEKRRLLEQLVAEAGDSQDSTGPSSRQSSRASSVDRFVPPLPPGTPEASPGPSGSSTPFGAAPKIPSDLCFTPLSTPKEGAASYASPSVDEEGDPFSTPLSSGSHSFLSTSGSASISKTLSTPVTKVMKEPLPDVNRFKSGVQDHIPFENLPNATGTYDKMKDIIANIRMLRKAQSS